MTLVPRAGRRAGILVVACLLLLPACALRSRPLTLAIALLPSELALVAAPARALHIFSASDGRRLAP